MWGEQTLFPSIVGRLKHTLVAARVITASVRRTIIQAIAAGIGEPDYANIAVPALGIYATFELAEDLVRVWYDTSDAALMDKVRRAYEMRSRGVAAQIEKFANTVPHAEVLELSGAQHNVFLSNGQEVIDAVNRFAERLQ